MAGSPLPDPTYSGGTKNFNSIFVPNKNETYSYTGFFQPVDNPPVVNSAKAGSAIPVKFSLGGNVGLQIFLPGYPASGLSNACGSADPVDAIDVTVTAGNSSLQFDPGSNQYIYVWKTDKSWAGTCRQLQIKLNDGSLHIANFKSSNSSNFRLEPELPRGGNPGSRPFPLDFANRLKGEYVLKNWPEIALCRRRFRRRAPTAWRRCR